MKLKAPDDLEHYMTACSRLKADVKEARHHWKKCEEGWNKSIKQAEGFLRELAAIKSHTGEAAAVMRAVTNKFGLGILGYDLYERLLSSAVILENEEI